MKFSSLLILLILVGEMPAQELGEKWGTEAREREYYRVVDVPTPEGEVIEAGAFCTLPDGRLAVGTRRGDIFLMDGVDVPRPEPEYRRFATGLDEIFGLDYRNGAFYVTQSCELTKVMDTDGDQLADRFEVISDAWGYANYHEYAFGSKVDPEGNVYVALGLSYSYHSRALFRGWVLKVTPEGETIPVASGLRSPAGIGPNEHGAMMFIESQGPWNSSNSLKVVSEGSFHGHPISFNWYPFASNLGDAPTQPESGGRIITERERVPELTPYAVIFPYIRMGRSLTGFTVDQTGGKFGPFEDQIFIGDFTLSLIMRATTERVGGIWQGACYPFREGLSTGILNVHFTPEGNLLAGGTNRGWPVRGVRPFALERLEWTGKMPFEVERVSITPKGFRIEFTKPVDRVTGTRKDSYRVSTFTHIYHGGYGGPEVDQTIPEVTDVALSEDGMEAVIELSEWSLGHVHELDLEPLRSRDGEELLHHDAYYTVHAVPEQSPGEESSVPRERWLEYQGKEGLPGNGKKVVLIAADQEYRSEQAMPMLAKILSERHGFDTTVLFALNENGMVDPTQKIKWQDESIVHDIPGLEQLAEADLMILYSRLVTLPDGQLQHFYDYLDAGKPIMAFRTANHGFIGFEYVKDGKRIDFGEDVLGGSFRGHHGRWHQDSTLGTVIDAAKGHPVVRGIDTMWGPTDVYRTYPEGGSLPEGCTALVMGQPQMTREEGSGDNLDLIPLPVVWVKSWTGRTGKSTRVFHSTMGSGKDFEDVDVRRVAVNAAYWCLGMGSQIDSQSNVDPVGEYVPLASGFNYPKLGVEPRPVSSFK
ncbi:MAG: ThuA domain-containing protein [Planctomycetes bacterium]|nr:ThuA domain-containing protein [Planctomycetota bacterium]